MPEFNYKSTTTVPPETTAADMMKILHLMGARNINMEFDDEGPVGMRFSVVFNDQTLHYKMPIRWEAIYETWKKEKEAKATRAFQKGWKEKLQKQARWTSWRIALEWLKIQMTFIQTGARDAQEVFMSDMIVNAEGETLGQLFLDGRMPKLLAAAPEDM